MVVQVPQGRPTTMAPAGACRWWRRRRAWREAMGCFHGGRRPAAGGGRPASGSTARGHVKLLRCREQFCRTSKDDQAKERDGGERRAALYQAPPLRTSYSSMSGWQACDAEAAAHRSARGHGGGARVANPSRVSRSLAPEACAVRAGRVRGMGPSKTSMARRVSKTEGANLDGDVVQKQLASVVSLCSTNLSPTSSTKARQSGQGFLVVVWPRYTSWIASPSFWVCRAGSPCFTQGALRFSVGIRPKPRCWSSIDYLPILRHDRRSVRLSVMGTGSCCVLSRPCSNYDMAAWSSNSRYKPCYDKHVSPVRDRVLRWLLLKRRWIAVVFPPKKYRLRTHPVRPCARVAVGSRGLCTILPRTRRDARSYAKKTKKSEKRNKKNTQRKTKRCRKQDKDSGATLIYTSAASRFASGT